MQALIFDTETTGLTQTALMPLDKQPEIIELYAALVDLDSGEYLGEFDSLFKPQKPVDEKSKAHKKVGITNAMLTDAPRFSDRAQRLKQIMEGSPLILAHNAAFDTEVMDIEMKRLGMTIKWPPVRCSVEQTVHLKGYRLSLTVMHEYLFNEKFPDSHRAKPDTQALIRCCCELRKRGTL